VNKLWIHRCQESSPENVFKCPHLTYRIPENVSKGRFVIPVSVSVSQIHGIGKWCNVSMKENRREQLRAILTNNTLVIYRCTWRALSHSVVIHRVIIKGPYSKCQKTVASPAFHSASRDRRTGQYMPVLTPHRTRWWRLRTRMRRSRRKECSDVSLVYTIWIALFLEVVIDMYNQARITAFSPLTFSPFPT